ncbi:MAG: histidine phosphatase family protein [Candidatus Krumholzibacteria bacterium]|nr:histidine phosphatase family protein [Candidatus Krumholzibacteria bacterium]
MLIYMIRHGRTDWNDQRRIMGREQVPLNEKGRDMVAAVAGQLAAEGISAIYSGTLARTKETSRILAASWDADIIFEPRLDESTYEKWVGRKYTELKGDHDFDLYGTAPTESNFSEGEGMTDIQQRVLAVIDRIAQEKRGIKTALVSHADLIKPVITHYLGMDLDTMHRLAVANASVTVLDLGYPGTPRIRYMNLMPWKWKEGIPDPPNPE